MINMENSLSTEITIRVESDLLLALDRVAKNTGLSSSRAAIEKILQRWHETWLQLELDRKTEEYYKSLTPEEIEEDSIWTQFASEQAMQRWDDK